MANSRETYTEARRTARYQQHQPDRQTLLVRRAIAVGSVLLAFILLIFGIKGCMNSRDRSALKNYNREVASIIQESDDNVSREFFKLLNSVDSSSSNELQSKLYELDSVANSLVKRTKALDAPDAMSTAQSDLLETMEFRAEALKKISTKLPLALSKGSGSQTAGSIAAQMKAFSASDVIYSWRVKPEIERQLRKKDITDQRVVTSQFLPTSQWILATYVADKLKIKSSGSGSSKTTVAPGLHGFSLNGVSVGDTALQPDAANRLTASQDLAFNVKLQNQGEHDESDIVVSITVASDDGGKPIKVTRTIQEIKQGVEATLTVPLAKTPPIGSAVTITVAIKPVPGEKKADNNKQSYTAIFSE